MSRTPWLGAVLLAALAVSAASGMPRRANPPRPEPVATVDCPADNVRNTDRAILCARVVDARTGVGVPGGDAWFVRKDGASMLSMIERDGTLDMNVPGGQGTLTISWSCRPSVKLVDTLTIPPGTGMERTFRVAITPADTLCRRESDDLSDTSRAAVQRWMDRGPCLALSFGRWEPLFPAAALPSGRVRLDTALPTTGEPASSHPLHYTPPSGMSWRGARWMPQQADSIQLRWNRDFDGVTVTLGIQGDSLAGWGMWVSDMIMTDSLGFLDRTAYPNGTASARWVPCE